MFIGMYIAMFIGHGAVDFLCTNIGMFSVRDMGPLGHWDAGDS